MKVGIEEGIDGLREGGREEETERGKLRGWWKVARNEGRSVEQELRRRRGRWKGWWNEGKKEGRSGEEVERRWRG